MQGKYTRKMDMENWRAQKWKCGPMGILVHQHSPRKLHLGKRSNCYNSDGWGAIPCKSIFI